MTNHFSQLLEETMTKTRLWVGAERKDARDILLHGLSDKDVYGGAYGYGWYFSTDPSIAGNPTDDEDDVEDTIVLEYFLSDDAHVLFPAHGGDDEKIWHASEPFTRSRAYSLSFPKRGIDAVAVGDTICVYNLGMLTFNKVYAGVVDDPLEETDTDELDEFALGGLARCTAVTVNALLRHFHIVEINLSEVPVNHPGVLAILNKRRLAYRPDYSAPGHTLLQFANQHQFGSWYLLTPGHAIALIDGELFDAENKGADGRKLEAAFQIFRR